MSYLLFVDDTIVFCEVSQDQTTNLCWFLLLIYFEVILGFKINLEDLRVDSNWWGGQWGGVGL